MFCTSAQVDQLQNAALKNSAKHMYATNEELRKEIEEMKMEKARLDKKIVEMAKKGRVNITLL